LFAYIGGKSRQAKWISSLIPSNLTRYTEVFGGAMWVYIKSNISADEIYYNDVNTFLTNVFQCFSTPDKFIPYLELYVPKDKELFLKLLKGFKSIENIEGERIKTPDFDLAAKYVYCITHSFSGLLQGYSDQKGYGSKFGAVMNRLNDPLIREKLSKIQALNLSFDEIIPKLDCDGGFFYLDPPYYGKENYYKFHSFTVNDHNRLINMLKEGIKSRWALSYYYFDELEEILPRNEYIWKSKEFTRVASFQKGMKAKNYDKGEELLIMNYDIEERYKTFF
jgi:DNA adenine methylase